MVFLIAPVPPGVATASVKQLGIYFPKAAFFIDFLKSAVPPIGAYSA